MEKTGLKIQEICLLTIAITNGWLVYTDKPGYVLKNLCLMDMLHVFLLRDFRFVCSLTVYPIPKARIK